MVRVGVSMSVVLLAAAGIADAQPAPQPPSDAPTNQEAPPDAKPATPTPAPPPAPPPAIEAPPAKPSPYEQCRDLRRRLGAEADATSDLKERTRLLQSMPDCKPDMDAPAAAPAESEGEQPSADGSGFAVEVHLETGQIFIDSNSLLPTTQAGLFLGHRGRTVTIGVGLDVGRVTSSSSDSLGMSSSRSSNMLLIVPGLRVVLARSHDDKTELLGQVDIGYGRNWASVDSGMDAGPSTGHLRVQAAPGLRYWISPSFAVGATGGLRYERFSRTDTSGGGSASMDLSVTALFSSIQLTGVF